MPGELYDESPREMMADALSDIGTIKVSPVQMLQKVIERRKLTYVQAYERYADQLVTIAAKYPESLLEAMTFLTDLRYGAYLQQVWDVVITAQKEKGYSQWVQLYKDYAVQLREISEWKGDQADSARDLLSELYLAQTQPGEPMEDDIDPYTGEVEAKEEFVKFNENDADMDDPEMMSFIASGDFQGDLFDQEHEWNEAGEMTSVSIRQGEEQDLRPTEKLFSLRLRVARKLEDIRWEAGECLKTLVVPTDIPEDDREEWIDDQVRAHVEKSKPALKFIEMLNDISPDFEPQDIFIVFTSAVWLDNMGGLVRLSNGSSIETFADIHGDAILDYLTDEKSWKNLSAINNAPLDEPYDEASADKVLEMIDNYTDDFQEEFLKMLPETHPQAAQTRSFNAGMLDAIESGLSIKQAVDAGWREWRFETSPTGAKVYDVAISKGMTMKAAMTEFWKTAYATKEVARPRDRIVSADATGITVLTGTSNYHAERRITWGIARLKAQQSELVVLGDAALEFKKTLMGLMKINRWPQPLVAGLKA
jgi:hypothetical protein